MAGRLPPRIQKMALAAAEASLEAHLAVNNLHNTKSDLRRLKDLARLEFLKFDLEIKRGGLDLSQPFTRNEQGLAAAAMSSAHREIVRLEAALDLPRTPRPADVTKADTMRVAFNREQAREAVRRELSSRK
jgi:hypothetical protein